MKLTDKLEVNKHYLVYWRDDPSKLKALFFLTVSIIHCDVYGVFNLLLDIRSERGKIYKECIVKVNKDSIVEWNLHQLNADPIFWELTDAELLLNTDSL